MSREGLGSSGTVPGSGTEVTRDTAMFDGWWHAVQIFREQVVSVTTGEGEGVKLGKLWCGRLLAPAAYQTLPSASASS